MKRNYFLRVEELSKHSRGASWFFGLSAVVVAMFCLVSGAAVTSGTATTLANDDDQALSRNGPRPVSPARRAGVGAGAGQARAAAIARGRARSGRQTPLGPIRSLPLRVADYANLV